MKRGITIAVDGLSSCGKSTFAKAIANELAYLYIDTGAMYRAVSLAFLRANYREPEKLSEDVVTRFLASHQIAFAMGSTSPQVTLDGEVLADQIRTPEINAIVSSVASIPAVRNAMVAQQRRLGVDGAVVMDGRDIGQTVFPNAELKIFMTARPEIRAQRRYDELRAKGMSVSYEEILENLQHRDTIDQTRACDPMRKAEDAIELDNSELTPAQQLEWIRPIIAERLA